VKKILFIQVNLLCLMPQPVVRVNFNLREPHFSISPAIVHKRTCVVGDSEARGVGERVCVCLYKICIVCVVSEREYITSVKIE
jgi:hypothetical protein